MYFCVYIEYFETSLNILVILHPGDFVLETNMICFLENFKLTSFYVLPSSRVTLGFGGEIG